MKNISRQNQGFTLVELSIVLVIIGLIVGGIVGGQSLIQSAKIGKITTDLNKYTTAIRTYEDTYDYLPGDHLDAQGYFGTNCLDHGAQGSCNGDGDGKITTGIPNGEIYYVWHHLGLGKMLNQQYGAGYNNVEYAEGPVTGDKGATHYTLQSFTGGFGINLNYGTYISLVGTGGMAHWSQGALSPRDAAKIDKKIDDGIAYKGNLLTTASRWNNNSGGTCVSGSYYAAVSNFKLENSEKTCQIHFKYK